MIKEKRVDEKKKEKKRKERWGKGRCLSTDRAPAGEADEVTCLASFVQGAFTLSIDQVNVRLTRLSESRKSK